MLSDPEVVALVGTAYSSSAASAATLSSLRAIPIISPGSSAISLANKAQRPYFMRSIGSDAAQLTSMVRACRDFGWQHVAVIGTDSTWGREQISEFASSIALLDTGLNVAAYVIHQLTASAAYSRVQLVRSLRSAWRTGVRVFILLSGYDDVAEVVEVANNEEMTTAGTVWFGRSVHDGLMSGASKLEGFIAVSAVIGSETEMRRTLDARWPNETTAYDSSVHGAYSASDGMPFYGSNPHAPIYWDVGARAPDRWGMYVYDTVRVLALALDNITRSGRSPFDGTTLLPQLLQTAMSGVTGQLSFEPSSQDRTQEFGLFNLRSQGDALAYVSTGVLSPSVVEADLLWPGGRREVPYDGLSPLLFVAEVNIGVLSDAPMVGAIQALRELNNKR